MFNSVSKCLSASSRSILVVNPEILQIKFITKTPFQGFLQRTDFDATTAIDHEFMIIFRLTNFKIVPIKFMRLLNFGLFYIADFYG